MSSCGKKWTHSTCSSTGWSSRGVGPDHLRLPGALEQGIQRAGDDEKLQAFGPVLLDLMQHAAELAESSDYRG